MPSIRDFDEKELDKFLDTLVAHASEFIELEVEKPAVDAFEKTTELVVDSEALNERGTHRFVLRWQVSGTHGGQFALNGDDYDEGRYKGFAPTGVPVTTELIVFGEVQVARDDDGRPKVRLGEATIGRYYWDELDVLYQSGIRTVARPVIGGTVDKTGRPTVSRRRPSRAKAR